MMMNANPTDTALFLRMVLQSLNEKLAAAHSAHDRSLQLEATDHFLRGAFTYFLTLGKAESADQPAGNDRELFAIRRMFEEALAHVQALSDEAPGGSREPGGRARPRAYP